MYRTVLDSTRAKGHSFGLYPVPLVTHKTDGRANGRTYVRTYCARNTYYAKAGVWRTKLRHCFVPSIIHLPRLGGPRLGRTVRGWHNWKKAPGKPGRPSPSSVATKKRQDKSAGFWGQPRFRIALLLESIARRLLSDLQSVVTLDVSSRGGLKRLVIPGA